MFRSSTIIRELAMNLAKVIFTLKHSVKLRRYLLCGCVAACCHTTAPYVTIFREVLYAGYITQYILQYVIHPSYNISLKMFTKGDRNM